MPGLSKSLGVGESVTYTILVWLQETGVTQNTEQGGIFKAGVNVTTGGNSTGVTGMLGENTDSNYVYTTSGKPYVGKIGESIPNGMITYTSASSAIANFGHDFFIRHKVENDIIIESYIVFFKDDTIYYIKGGDNGAAYNTNIDILITAFGSSNCNYISNELTCGLSGLYIYTDVGRVGAYEDNQETGSFCDVLYEGFSRCESNFSL